MLDTVSGHYFKVFEKSYQKSGFHAQNNQGSISVIQGAFSKPF